MPDLTFVDAGFFATSVDVRPTTPAGAAWFAEHYGPAAVGVNIPKSKSFDMCRELAARGLTFDFGEAAS